MAELLAISNEMGAPIHTGMTTAQALQSCLDRVVALYWFAARKVDELSSSLGEDGEVDDDEFWEVRTGPNGALSVVPNRWITYETEMRKEVEHLAGLMTQLGIAERSVRIQEAQAVMMIGAIRDAAVEAGIPAEQVRLLGEGIRARIADASASINPEHASRSRSQSSATGSQVGHLGPGH